MMKIKRKVSLIIALTVAVLFVAETAYAGYTTPEIYGQNIGGSFSINDGATHTTLRDVTLNNNITPSWRYYQYYFQSWFYNFVVNTPGFVPPYYWSGYKYVGGYYPYSTTIDRFWDAYESPYPGVNANGFRVDFAGIIWLSASWRDFSVLHDDGAVLLVKEGIAFDSGGVSPVIDDWIRTDDKWSYGYYFASLSGSYTLFVHHFNYVSPWPRKNDARVYVPDYSTRGGLEWALPYQMRFSNDGINWSNREPYSSTKDWTLSPGEGIKTVYAQFTDTWGYLLTTSDTIIFEIPDKIPPVTEISLDGTLGNNDWYVSDVLVTLTATDEEGGSGVDKTEYSFNSTNWLTYSEPFLITIEGETTIYYRSIDNAGNVEEAKEGTIKIDKTPPVIIGAPTTEPNENGWYNDDVVIHFEATDTISGIDTITPDVIISTEGENQSVTGTATDIAGNSASYIVEGINIDKTAPNVQINSPIEGAKYILNQEVIADWIVEDSLSGIDDVTATNLSGEAIDTSSVGGKTFTVTATDMAGNVTTETVTYYVCYNFGGLLPPFKEGKEYKLGRVIPLKFQLTDADENFITDATARLYLAKIEDGVPGEEIEATPAGNSNEGNLFRYDEDNDLYIFNLSTDGLSVGTWQLRIELDDGTSKYATITLR